MNKYLIVTADDFGLTESANKAIIDCFKGGIVRSVSLMANGNAFENAVQSLKQNAGISAGVHLTLVFERPVLGPNEIQSLVREDGRLFQTHNQFIKRYLAHKIRLKEVEDELSAQISKIKDRGIDISHINSHQHLHVLPGIIEIVIGLAVKYRIKNIRVPLEWSYLSMSPNNLFLNILSLRAMKKIQKARLNCIDHFRGSSVSGHLTESSLLNFIMNCKEGVTEIMCHPTYIDEFYQKNYLPHYKRTGYKHEPLKEVAALTSKKIKEEIEKKGIKLIGFQR
jgi:predicted glycoside hydrolase/deacetylase ChbG (UPF0249 family)